VQVDKSIINSKTANRYININTAASPEIDYQYSCASVECRAIASLHWEKLSIVSPVSGSIEPIKESYFFLTSPFNSYISIQGIDYMYFFCLICQCACLCDIVQSLAQGVTFLSGKLLLQLLLSLTYRRQHNNYPTF
jgi:hypothetical protein